MPRAGRQLELLTAEIEKALSPAPVKVISPYFVPDRDTGQNRETDVGIIGHLGSTQLLIIVECREREGAQDVTWIEQLASKRESMSAAKAVAVSVDGFTAPARIKAKALGIELREMKELKHSDIAGWCAPIGAMLSVRRAILGNTTADVEVRRGQKIPSITSFKGNQRERIFWHRIHPDGLSYMDFWESVSRGNPAWNSIPGDGTIHDRRVRISFAPSEGWHWMGEGQKYLLQRISIEARLWKQVVFSPWSRISGYDSDTGRLAETAQAIIQVEGRDVTVGLVRNATGEISTSIVGLDPNFSWDIQVTRS